jgi:hypothetical protein
MRAHLYSFTHRHMEILRETSMDSHAYTHIRQSMQGCRNSESCGCMPSTCSCGDFDCIYGAASSIKSQNKIARRRLLSNEGDDHGPDGDGEARTGTGKLARCCYLYEECWWVGG